MSFARATAFSKALRKWSQSEVPKTRPSAFERRRASTASERPLSGISRPAQAPLWRVRFEAEGPRAPRRSSRTIAPACFGQRVRIAELAAKNRLPTLAGFKEFAQAGGLMTYSASLPDLHRRAAIYVDKILKGAKPADLPVEQPTKYDFVINLKTAKALGLTIPQTLLLRADQVIDP
jgi:hypothetical protein